VELDAQWRDLDPWVDLEAAAPAAAWPLHSYEQYYLQLAPGGRAFCGFPAAVLDERMRALFCMFQAPFRRLEVNHQRLVLVIIVTKT
jgi:hypothetical protein